MRPPASVLPPSPASPSKFRSKHDRCIRPHWGIGRQVVQNLLKSNAPIRVIARDPPRLAEGVLDRVEIIEGSHGDARIVNEAFNGATLPDIDLLVISVEPTLGYVIFVCELKCPVPPRWAKDQLKVLNKDSVSQAFRQVEVLRRFGQRTGFAFFPACCQRKVIRISRASSSRSIIWSLHPTTLVCSS